MAYVYDSDSSDDYNYNNYDEGDDEEEEDEENEDVVPDCELWRAVDVKFVRVAPPGGGAPQTVLAAVAVVDARQRVRFFSYARPRGAVLSAAGAPGIDADELNAAPDAERVAAAAADELRGCMLIAHGAGLALRLLGLERDELACVYDVNERGYCAGMSFRNAAACLGFSPEAVSPAYWPAPRVACALMQLMSLSLQNDDTAQYVERVLRFLGRCDGEDANGDAYDRDADERCRFYSFGELGNECAMPPELRCDYTYPRLFEECAWGCLEIDQNRNGIRPRPLPWHVAPTRVETAEEGVARRAGAYETQLVAFLADRSGVDAGSGVNIGFVSQHCALPANGVGKPTLGAFLRARPALFTRSRCGNYVWLTPAPQPTPQPHGAQAAGRAAAAPAAPAAAPRAQAAAAAAPRAQAQAPQRAAAAAAPAAPRAAPAAADRSCAVCMASPKEGAFLPCMHKCCCMACGEAIMRRNALCPICRCEADRFAFVYE
jgi:hypothetical protein